MTRENELVYLQIFRKKIMKRVAEKCKSEQARDLDSRLKTLTERDLGKFPFSLI
jgi:hypothetical protein